jgi:tetratricopeptide (TPR) repeat protein
MRTSVILVVAALGGLPLTGSRAHSAEHNSAPGTHSAQAVAELTRQAHEDFASGKYSEARDKLRAALKRDPSNAVLWTYLGLTDAQLNQTDSAIADFEKALSLAPETPRTLFNLGLLYRRKGDAGKAIEIYRRGLALAPDDPAANQNYGLLLMEVGKFREAIEPLERLKTLEGSDLSVRVALIECYLKGGLQSEAERELRAFLEAPNVTADEKIKLAGVLVEDKQPDAAQQVLEQTIRSSPDSAEAHARLGTLLVNKNQYEDAAEQLGRAVQLVPDSAQYSMLLAEDLILWKHYPVALLFLNAVKERFGNLPDYRYKVGLAYYGMHRYPQAATEFEALARQQPRLDLVQFFLGNSYTAMGELTKAESYFRKAIDLNPKNASYYAALAQLLRKESDDKTDEAILNLQKALALDPSDALSKQELALCYEKKRNYPQAEQLLEEVVCQQPDLVSAHVALSRIYYRQHKKDEGDREKKIVARLEGQQQTEQSQTYKTSPSPVQ